MAGRRQILVAGAGVALWVAGFQVLPGLLSRGHGFDFEPIERLPGFRTISGGSTSSQQPGGGFDVTVGLDRPEPLPPGVTEAVEADPAGALFFEGAGSGDTVPVAYVFDYYCPYCRVLSGHLGALVDASDILLSRHHWPIFGEASELAARASLAAGRQGDGTAIHDRLMGTPARVTPDYLRILAEDAGLSWPRMERDMASAPVDAALNRARALSRLFGLIGTPALVVGRTLVQGEISEARLRDLVQHERDERRAASSGG